MKKIVVFNVGGALSSYAEFDNQKVVIDLGKSSEFSPTADFLRPLAVARNFDKVGGLSLDNECYVIDQLFLSHLDNDHTSDFIDFRGSFRPSYMTCPSDNDTQLEEFKVNRELLGDISDVKAKVLQEMKGRSAVEPKKYSMSKANPLISTLRELTLFYIRPQYCEQDETLKQNYANNISLVLFIQIGNTTILFPGDIMTEGMDCLIDNCEPFRSRLSAIGVDYLIAPHHGLRTAFSKSLFSTMKNNKSQLNIISEKVRSVDQGDNRSDVDSRYYSGDYSSGANSLNQYGVKTSGGHLVIDLEGHEAKISVYTDIQDVIGEFIA